MVEEQKSKAVAVLTPEREKALDIVASYGKREATNTAIIGLQLKFVKGEWYAGSGNDADVLKDGTKLVFNLDSTTTGHQRWEDGKVVDVVMGPVIEGFQPRLRSELSTPNQADWPEDERGFKKDPWAKSTMALMKEPGKKGQVYTLTIGQGWPQRHRLAAEGKRRRHEAAAGSVPGRHPRR
jgi:hypothetical protein